MWKYFDPVLRRIKFKKDKMKQLLDYFRLRKSYDNRNSNLKTIVKHKVQVGDRNMHIS